MFCVHYGWCWGQVSNDNDYALQYLHYQLIDSLYNTVFAPGLGFQVSFHHLSSLLVFSEIHFGADFMIKL